MQLSNEKLITYAESLKSLSNKRLPISLSYAISKNYNKITSSLKDFEESKKILLEKYCDKDKNGEFVIEDGRYKVSDKTEEFNKDFEELLSIENEIDIHNVLVSTLERCDGEQFDTLTVADIFNIQFMIEE